MKLQSVGRRAVGGLLVTGLCFVGMSAIAGAQEPNISGSELPTQEVASEVASAIAAEGQPASTGAAAVTDNAAGVSVPVAGSEIALSLPNANVDGKTASSTVLDGAGQSQAAVQNVGSDGTRVAFIINSASDPTRYALNVSGAASIVLQVDGSAVLTNEAGDPLATIAPPWAKDASGTDVPTRYEVDGNQLVQIVEHQSANIEYPVTADPWARSWWGYALYLNRSQTNHAMLGMAGATAASLWIPDPTVTKVVATILGLYTGYANWAYNRGACLRINVPWTVVGWNITHYSKGYCR